MEKINIIERLKKYGVEITPEQETLFRNQMERDFDYIPKIGIFGKTGAGKSSLFNAIYGEELCAVSDVEACTSKLQEADAGGVILVDCPGIAESDEKDKEYMEMYMNLIPTLDAIFWVLKGDDRAYMPDLKFYDSIKDRFVRKDKTRAPFFFVLNQVDKIEPFREWDISNHKPGENQLSNILKKIDYVASIFTIAPSKVIAVSAAERYNLVTLINNLLGELPSNQSIIVFEDLRQKEYKRNKEEIDEEIEKITNSEEVKNTQKKKQVNYFIETLKKVGVAVKEKVLGFFKSFF